MNYDLIAYAQDFVSFFLQNSKSVDKVSMIILFGSVVRGEAKKSSDIDLFIETKKDIEKEVGRIKEEFYKSVKVKKYWSLLGIKNELHCEIGELREWKELEKSLIAQGIVLYGKYKSKKQGKLYYLFTVQHDKKRNRNISLWRKLYGYKQRVNNKVYVKEGLVKEYEGEKIARGVFIIPSEHAQKIMLFLKNNKINRKIVLIWKEE
jgi:predicted nucleotidyltransferase